MIWKPVFHKAWMAGLGSLLVLFTIVGNLQAALLTGTVTNGDGTIPLAGANLQIEGTHFGTSSDLDGRFTLSDLAPGTYRLRATHVGYAADYSEVTLSDSPVPVIIHFYLTPDILEFQPVVYTATRTLQSLKDVPVATEVVSQRDIEQTAATTAAEALTNEIGVDIRDDFSGRGISIQGVDPDRVLVLLNGNRIVGRINGSIDLDQISTLGVKQIEVVKGAVSTLYGSEAIGGVVNIITENAQKPLQLTLDMQGGGYVPSDGFEASTYSPSVDVGYRKGRFAFRSGVRYRSNGAMDVDPSTPETEGIEQTNRLNSHLSTDIRLADPVLLSLNAELMREEKEWVEESGHQSIDLYFDDEELNRRQDVSAELRCEPTWADLYTIRLYHTRSRHAWDKYTRDSHQLVNYSENNEDYTQLSLQLTRTLGGFHRVTFGADASQWDVDAFSVMTTNVSEITTSFDAWDAFFQDEWLLTDRWTIVPGVRFESHDLYASHLSPKVAVRWQATDDLVMRASVGQGYRAPTAKELFYNFNHAAAGYVVIGNPDLNPERSTSANLSFEHTYSDRSSSRISFFYNDLLNMIEYHELYRTQDLPVGVYRYDNIIAAWIGGMELERNWRIGNDLECSVAYSYTESRDQATDNRLLRTPAHTGRTSATWSPGRNTIHIYGRFVGAALFTDKFTTGDLSSDRWTTPYTQWNLVLSRKISGGMRFYLKGENLFDVTNSEYGPYQGRILLAGWSWNYFTD